MKMTKVKTAEEARQKAIYWQHWQADERLYMSELVEWVDYFRELVERFPELEEEFRENAII